MLGYTRRSAPRRRALRDFDAGAGTRAGAHERGRHELAEERRRARRRRLDLRMELRRDEPGMVRQLDDLDQPPLLERAADHEATVEQLLSIGVVHLVAMAMPLGDHRLAVDLAGARSL